MIGADSNQVILESLSDKVYGHLEAKKVLINLVNKARLRYYAKWGMLETVPKLHNNCLLIGPSGTGKTFLLEQLREVCPFPFLKFDATQIQPDGNSSEFTPSKIIKKIKAYLKESVEDGTGITEEGIADQLVVFIDEVDKLANSFDSSGNWNKQVQSNLLTIIENSGEFSGISFVFAGAFDGLEPELADEKKPGIGFFDQTVGDEKKAESVDLTEKLIKFGLIPEFVGRIGNIVKLDPLKLKDYKKIAENYVLPQKNRELSLYYRYTDDLLSNEEIESLVERVYKSGLGVRGIKREVDKMVLEKEFNYETLTDVLLLPTIT